MKQQLKSKQRRPSKMDKIKKLKIEIMRYNPETNDVQYSVTYEVPYDEHTSLLEALGYIKDYLAPDLSYRAGLVVWQDAAIVV